MGGIELQISIGLTEEGAFKVFSEGLLDEIAYPESDTLLFSRSTEQLATFQWDENKKVVTGKFLGNYSFIKKKE